MGLVACASLSPGICAAGKCTHKDPCFILGLDAWQAARWPRALCVRGVQVFLQLPDEDKKALDAMQKEVRARHCG